MGYFVKQFACQTANPNSWISCLISAYYEDHDHFYVKVFDGSVMRINSICFPEVVLQCSANKACNEGRLKEEAREKRGNGVHSKVPLNTLGAMGCIPVRHRGI